jgi:hypothetical protein
MFFKNPKELGQHFRELRSAKKLSISKLARKIGFPNGYLQQVEIGEIWNPGSRPGITKYSHASNNIWECLAKYFGLSYKEIVQNSYLKFGRFHPRILDPETISLTMSSGKSVEDVLNELCAGGAYDTCKKRISPTKTYLLKFARARDYDSLKMCPVSVLDLSVKGLKRAVEDASENAGYHALRNFKNNLMYFVREARRYGLLPPDGPTLISDYSLRNRENTKLPRLYSNTTLPKYRLTPEELVEATGLSGQLKDYFDFSTNILRAPRPIRKRKLTMKTEMNMLLLRAGFLVHRQSIALRDVSLEKLADPDVVQSYVAWLIERNIHKYEKAEGVICDGSFSGVTEHVGKHVIQAHTMAKYYLKDASTSERLKDLHHKLDNPTRIKDKEKLLVSLRDLERVGMSLYPFNSSRIQEMSASSKFQFSQLLEHMRTMKTFLVLNQITTDLGTFDHRYLGRRFAHRVNFSLMIRLLVRIPLRQRNIREMKLGTNLVKDGEKYVIQFRGEQLKIARRGKLTNKLTFQIEPDGTGFYELLDEWLSIWRPCLLNVHRTYIQTEEGQRVINKIQSQCQDVYHSYQGDLPPDSGRVDHDYVFMNQNGIPWTSKSLSTAFKIYCYRYLGVPLTPHLVRDCWATEYLVKTRDLNGHPDVVGAAEMLGDTVQTIYKHYAHILGEKAQVRPKKWLHDYLLGDVNRESEDRSNGD